MQVQVQGVWCRCRVEVEVQVVHLVGFGREGLYVVHCAPLAALVTGGYR